MNRHRRAAWAVPTTLVISQLLITACTPPDPAAAPVSAADASVALSDADVGRLADTVDPHTLYVVSQQYATGDGVDLDPGLAAQLWQQACDRGHVAACSIYGARLMADRRFDTAARALTRAAKAGDVEAMTNLVALHGSAEWAGASTAERARWFDALRLSEQPAQSPLPAAP